MAKKLSKADGKFRTLNFFNANKMHQDDTVFCVIEITGKGEVPSKGQQLIKKMTNDGIDVPSLNFCPFGIGDMTTMKPSTGHENLSGGFSKRNDLSR